MPTDSVSGCSQLDVGGSSDYDNVEYEDQHLIQMDHCQIEIAYDDIYYTDRNERSELAFMVFELSTVEYY